jgi:general secretion pathway protein G
MTGRTGSWRTPLQRGFTLIELLVVMMIIGTLLSIAVPRYFRTLAHARETVLRQDLAILREAIDKYYADLGQYPDTLAALADKRYVRSLPVDPYTKLPDTWTLVQSDDPDHPGIKDVHSGASETAADGSPFASW